MSEMYKEDQTVSTVFGKDVSWKQAKKLFDYGNLLRYFAVGVLVYHAAMYISRQTKQPELLFFAILQLVDILMRLPLSTSNSKTQRNTVIRFGFLYVVLVGLYSRTMTGTVPAVVIVIVLTILTAILVKNTKKIEEKSS